MCSSDLACGSAGASFAVTPLSASYYGTWTLQRAQAAFFFTGMRNLPAGSGGGGDKLEASRPGTDSQYTLARFGASFVKAFEKDWQMRLNLVAQYTDTPLVAPEQFGAGGMNSVRGFLEREVSNDRGYTANVEGYTPDIAGRAGMPNWSLRLLAFYDRASLSRVEIGRASWRERV